VESGSVSVDLLAGSGYEVIASTGKAEAHDYLMGLGAYEVIGRTAARGREDPSRWASRVCRGSSTASAATRCVRVESR
jgi:hypothetical protein